MSDLQVLPKPTMTILYPSKIVRAREQTSILIRPKLKHTPRIQQQKRLIPQPPPHRAPVLPINKQPRPRENLPIPVKKPSPITRLRRRREIPLPKCLDAVLGDLARLVGVLEQVGHFLGEVGEVALDLDVVLQRAGGDEEVVVVLDVLQFVNHGDGGAGLAVFEGGGVGAAWAC